MQARLHTVTRGLVLTCLALGLQLAPVGCDEGGGGGASEEAAAKADDGKGDAAEGKEDPVAKLVNDQIDANVSDEQVKSFLKDQAKKGCEMLPPAMVAKVLEIPEAELRQMKIVGCIYTWQDAPEGQDAQASISTIMVLEDVAAAEQWFANATKNKTGEELRAELAMVTGKAKEHESIDTKTKEKTVDQLGGMMGAMMPDAGYQYEDVPGVGDAARVLTHDGKLTVRVGNMVFTVGAFKGQAAPPPDMAAVTSGDMKRVMAASKESEAKWLDLTRDARRQQGIELAKAIVAGL
ncbi:MAG: hypothetical protein KC457_14950 [Myxococcales bacterium]|nr:hypothetical protein [Myxococcales bacterium]